MVLEYVISLKSSHKKKKISRNPNSVFQNYIFFYRVLTSPPRNTRKRKIQGIPTVFFKTTCFFLQSFDVGLLLNGGTPFPSMGGRGWAILKSLPSSNCIRLSESFKIFWVQGILGSLFLPCVNASYPPPKKLWGPLELTRGAHIYLFTVTIAQ